MLSIVAGCCKQLALKSVSSFCSSLVAAVQMYTTLQPAGNTASISPFASHCDTAQYAWIVQSPQCCRHLSAAWHVGHAACLCMSASSCSVQLQGMRARPHSQVPGSTGSIKIGHIIFPSSHLQLQAAALMCFCCCELPWSQVDLPIQLASAVIDHHDPLQTAQSVVCMPVGTETPNSTVNVLSTPPCCLLLPARHLWGSTGTAPGHPQGPVVPQQTASSANS